MSTQRFTNRAISPLVSGINSSQTTIQVANASGFPQNANFSLIIDQEIMRGTFVVGNTITVVRGQEGTTAAAHNAGAQVAHVLTKEGILKSIATANDLRISLQNGSPIETSDVLAADHVYLNGMNGNKITLYDISTGLPQLHTLDAQASIAIPSGNPYQQYNVHVYDNGGTLALELEPWARLTGSITGATNANPIVITSNNHGLAANTMIVCDGLTGNTSANQVPVVIGNPTTNTFELTGVAGNGTYTGGGNWYTLQTGNPGFSFPAGFPVKPTDFTRRYVGSICTWGTSGGTSESSQHRRLIYNMYNQQSRPLLFAQLSGSWTYATAAWRPVNGDYIKAGCCIQNGYPFTSLVNLIGVELVLSISGNTSLGLALNSYQGVGIQLYGYNSGVAGVSMQSQSQYALFGQFSFIVLEEFVNGSATFGGYGGDTGASGFIFL